MAIEALFFITWALLAFFWLTLRSDIRGLTDELRKAYGDPDRILDFDRAIHQATQRRIADVMNEPVSPRELLPNAQHPTV